MAAPASFSMTKRLLQMRTIKGAGFGRAWEQRDDPLGHAGLNAPGVGQGGAARRRQRRALI